MSVVNLDRLTLDAINAEFMRAYVAHNGRTPKNPEMGDGERLAILVEEVGEVARCLTYDQNRERLVKELLQVCAMAAAWIEHAERAV